MTDYAPRADATLPAVALALGAVGALSLGVGDAVGSSTPTTEGIWTLTWLAGWALVLWALVLGAVSGGLLVRRGIAHRSVSPVPVALVTAVVLLAVVVWSLFPLWGRGSGQA